jgi:hypothetical protein
MTISFTAALGALKTQLEGNAALAAFCQSKWNRDLTVSISYKKRVEIHTSDLPVILITRPSVAKSHLTGARDGQHTVRLYAGFHQPDRAQAQLDLIEFEELLDDAVLSDHTLGGTAISAIPTESANDEGEHHPVYFMAADVEVKHRREEA